MRLKLLIVRFGLMYVEIVKCLTGSDGSFSLQSQFLQFANAGHGGAKSDTKPVARKPAAKKPTKKVGLYANACTECTFCVYELVSLLSRRNFISTRL